MRRMMYVVTAVVLALCLVLLLVLAGVWTFSDATTPPEQTGSSGTGVTEDTAGSSGSDEIIWESRPMVSISLPRVTESITAEDGVLLFYHTFQDVVLSTDNAEVNKAVTLDLLRRMDSQSGTVSTLESLTQYYTPGTEWNVLFYEILYTPTRIDEHILSLRATQGISSGSGFPEYSGISVTYDLATGQAMTLSQLLSEESDAADRLCQALLAVLEEQKAALALYDDYAEVISRRFQSELQQESTWHLSDEGLCFNFAPYDIAPNSSGFITVTVPYSALTGILREQLLPAAQAEVEGTARIERFDTAELSGYQQFAECVLDPEADGLLITADTVLYDLQLTVGTMEADIFLPGFTVFAASCLDRTEAVVLYPPLIDSSRLLLRYRSNGQSYSAYLTYDGAGTPVLTPAQ